jgi:probable F420-dependent oxidoreductase
MKFGVCIPNFGEHLSVDAVRSVALAAEDFGYDSLWTTDHLVTPAGTYSPYLHIYESLAVLAYLAGVTSKVKVGSSIIVLPMRDPVLAAKQFATVDRLSGGHLIAGVAAGWAEGEFKALGSDFHNRGARLDEQIELLRALWTQPVVDFDGRYYKVRDIIFEPKPLQEGGPPIWVGGNSPSAAKRAAKLGNAWHATSIPLDEFERRVRELRAAAGRRQVAVTTRMAINLKASEAKMTKNPAGEKRVTWGGGVAGVSLLVEDYTKAGLEYLVAYFGDKEPKEYVKDMKHFAEGVVSRF